MILLANANDETTTMVKAPRATTPWLLVLMHQPHRVTYSPKNIVTRTVVTETGVSASSLPGSNMLTYPLTQYEMV